MVVNLQKVQVWQSMNEIEGISVIPTVSIGDKLFQTESKGYHLYLEESFWTGQSQFQLKWPLGQ